MKTFTRLIIIVLFAALFATGCTRFSSTLVEREYEPMDKADAQGELIRALLSFWEYGHVGGAAAQDIRSFIKRHTNGELLGVKENITAEGQHETLFLFNYYDDGLLGLENGFALIFVTHTGNGFTPQIRTVYRDGVPFRYALSATGGKVVASVTTKEPILSNGRFTWPSKGGYRHGVGNYYLYSTLVKAPMLSKDPSEEAADHAFRSFSINVDAPDAQLRIDRFATVLEAAFRP